MSPKGEEVKGILVISADNRIGIAVMTGPVRFYVKPAAGSIKN